MIIRKAAAEIERMARAGEVVAETLALVGEHARPGVTTQELDELADEFIRSRGGTPTFKGYRGYPASICASPNEMVVHGIPGIYALRDGDILSVDVGVTLPRAPEHPDECLVLEQRSVLHGAAHPDEVLEEDPAGADRQVTHLRVPHLARG